MSMICGLSKVIKRDAAEESNSRFLGTSYFFPASIQRWFKSYLDGVSNLTHEFFNVVNLIKEILYDVFVRICHVASLIEKIIFQILTFYNFTE